LASRPRPPRASRRQRLPARHPCRRSRPRGADPPRLGRLRRAPLEARVSRGLGAGGRTRAPPRGVRDRLRRTLRRRARARRGARARARLTDTLHAMSDDVEREFGFDTRAVHAGQRPDPYTGATTTPSYQSAGFVFEDTESAAAYFNLQEYGNIYSRIMNPTVAAFEERLANLENGAGAVAFASGLAAQAALFFV